MKKGEMKLNKTFIIKPYQSNDLIMHINTSQASILGINENDQLSLKFGNLKCSVSIHLSTEIVETEIYLSESIISQLYIPTYLSYELRIKNKEVIIGPYIGVLIKKSGGKISKSLLRRMLVYVREYSNLHGALVIFALNKIIRTNGLVEGYCYNPTNKNWVRGKFPYPASIFCKFSLNESWRNHFTTVIGNRWFNGQYINKWIMHKKLSEFTDIKPHLPDTILYETFEDIFDFLEKHKKVIVKPKNGTWGKRIVQICIVENKYQFKYTRKGKFKILTKKNKDKAITIMRNLFTPKKFIVQQQIDFVKFRDRGVDFRSIVQKDQTTEWKCLGIIARINAINRVVSNIHNGGKALPLNDMLKNYLYLSETEINNMNKKISKFSIDICNILDKLGLNLGNVGLDLGMDESGKLWIIEVNHRNPTPGPTLFVDNKELFLKHKTTPLFYAKSLAGFGISKELV